MGRTPWGATVFHGEYGASASQISSPTPEPAHRPQGANSAPARPHGPTTLSTMDRLRILAETQGFFTRADALAEGHDDGAIQRAIRSKLWVRVRVGAYTFSDLWSAADETRRHRLRSRAVMRKYGDRVALSHLSAAVEHGLAHYGQDLDVVHVTRLDGGAGRREAGVWHHEGLLVPDDLVEVDGMLMVKPERSALEAALLVPAGPGLVTIDSAMRRLGGRAAVDETFAQMRSWPGIQRLQVVVRLGDGRSESVGESLSRHLMHAHAIPMPELQFEVYDEQGNLIGTTDFAWPRHRLLGEFDGKVKYGRLLREGEKPEDAVFREKVREDLLRETTRWGMVRFIWRDLFHGAETAARVRRLMQHAA